MATSENPDTLQRSSGIRCRVRATPPRGSALKRSIPGWRELLPPTHRRAALGDCLVVFELHYGSSVALSLPRRQFLHPAHPQLTPRLAPLCYNPRRIIYVVRERLDQPTNRRNVFPVVTLENATIAE